MTNATGAQSLASDFHRDHEILKQIMSGFETYIKPFAKSNTYGTSKLNLFDLLWRSVLSYSIRDNQPVRAPRAYAHYDFNGLEEPRRGLFGIFLSPRPLTLTAALQEYLAHLPRRPLNDDYNRVVAKLKTALEPLPTLAQERSGRLTNAPFHHTVVTPLRHTAEDQNEATTSVSLPVTYKPSFVGSALASFLLGGVSRIAIMAAIGTTGAPLVAAAVVAGVGAGAVTSYYKNRAVIAQEVAQETTFAGRMGARWRGFKKSYSWKQFALNTATSAAGVVGGGALFEAIAENVPMPKLVSDFAAAAKSQIDGALEWTSDKATALTASMGVGAGPIQAGISSLRDVIGAEDTIAQSDIIDDNQSGIPVRVVTTIPISPDDSFSVPAENSVNRIEQAFADVAPLTADQQQAADMLKQSFADKTAILPDPIVAGNTLSTPDQPLSYVTQDVPVRTEAQAAIEAAAPDVAVVASHTVASGDRLWELAETLRGVSPDDADGHHRFIRQIMQANPELSNPNNLVVGQTLVIPPEDALEAQCRTTRGGGRYIGGCTPAMG